MANVSSYRKSKLICAANQLQLQLIFMRWERFSFMANNHNTSTLGEILFTLSFTDAIQECTNVCRYYHIRSKNQNIFIYQFIYISCFLLVCYTNRFFSIKADDLQICNYLSNLIKFFYWLIFKT